MVCTGNSNHSRLRDGGFFKPDILGAGNISHIAFNPQSSHSSRMFYHLSYLDQHRNRVQNCALEAEQKSTHIVLTLPWANNSSHTKNSPCTQTVIYPTASSGLCDGENVRTGYDDNNMILIKNTMIMIISIMTLCYPWHLECSDKCPVKLPVCPLTWKFTQLRELPLLMGISIAITFWQNLEIYPTEGTSTIDGYFHFHNILAIAVSIYAKSTLDWIL